mmetsp:Transcript_11464/g.24276  ORF Transcript_11464/g.24276 Transcript_11464/m.24276 type:complete len:714 (-) Transcript_11464:73-2214(-)
MKILTALFDVGGSADGPSVGHAGNVQVLAPLLLDVGAGEGARPQRLLRLVDGPLARDREDKGRLVRRRRAAGDPEARVPPPVDALARILKVEFHDLVDVSRVPGHDDGPAGVAGAHAGDVKAFLPLLVDPLERERVADLVALLREGGALAHHHKGPAHRRPRDAADVVPFLPPLHDPVLGQKSGRKLVHLGRVSRACVHDEGPELLVARDAADEEPVVVPLLDVLAHPDAGHVVVVPLLHGPVRIVHRDPLQRRNADANLLLRSLLLVARLVPVEHVPRTLLAHLGQGRLADLDRPHARRPAQRLKERNHPAVLGVLVVLQIHHVLGELLERRGRVLAHLVRARGHLLLADEEALVVALVPLPGQLALEQEHQGVSQRLEVIPARSVSSQVGVHARIAHRPPKDVRPLVVLDVRVAHCVPPPRRQAQIHQVELVAVGGPRGAHQEILRLHVAVNIPFRVEVFENDEGLEGDAGDHFLRHDLVLRVPHVPERRAQEVHHHDVVVPLPALVGNPRNAVASAERAVDAPLVRRAIPAPFAAPVLELQRHLIRPRSILHHGGTRHAGADIDLAKAALAELLLDVVVRGAADLRAVGDGGGAAFFLAGLGVVAGRRARARHARAGRVVVTLVPALLLAHEVVVAAGLLVVRALGRPAGLLAAGLGSGPGAGGGADAGSGARCSTGSDATTSGAGPEREQLLEREESSFSEPRKHTHTQ